MNLLRGILGREFGFIYMMRLDKFCALSSAEMGGGGGAKLVDSIKGLRESRNYNEQQHILPFP